MKLNFHRNGSGYGTAGFTMIEIALALGVIGFALVAIIGILPLGMSVQKDNREETLINFDANFLMDAITSGSRGQDDLTNHVISITNYLQLYNNLGVAVGKTNKIGYDSAGYYINGASAGPSYLTNGQNIIALLTIPKYIPYPQAGPGFFYSNYTTVDIRAISGSLVDEGTSQAAKDFAFTYRLYPEVIRADASWMTGANDVAVASDLNYNVTQIRLRFRWPILANGQAGTSHKVFRGTASGALLPVPAANGVPILTNNYFIQPGTYTAAP